MMSNQLNKLEKKCCLLSDKDSVLYEYSTQEFNG